jgi:hypothetical protein
MMRFALFFAAAAAFAIDGTVLNQTTGKPQPGASVTLFSLQSGMQPVETVKSDAQGKFAFTKDEPGAALLQATYEGVTYNQMLQPGSARTGIPLAVYNVSMKGDAEVKQHMMLFEPGPESMLVSESYIVGNTGNVTVNNPESGALRFSLPPGAKGIVQVNATAPQGMPVRRNAEKTAQANVFKVDFPLKPGETRIDLTYLVPGGAPFEGRVLFRGDGTTRLVAPAGVELKGEGITSIGQEPSSRATIYSVASKEFTVEVAGTGSLRQPQTESAGSEGPRVQQIMPRLFQGIDGSADLLTKIVSVKWIVALAFAVLSLGFVLLYRAGTPAHARSDRGRR